MKAIVAGEIDVVVVGYKDRLARFGYTYLELFCESHGARIEAIEEKASADEHEALVKDLMSVVTSYSARLYRRSGGRKIKEALEEQLRGERTESPQD